MASKKEWKRRAKAEQEVTNNLLEAYRKKSERLEKAEQERVIRIIEAGFIPVEELRQRMPDPASSAITAHYVHSLIGRRVDFSLVGGVGELDPILDRIALALQ